MLSSGRSQSRAPALTTTACPGLKQTAVHFALFSHQGSELGTQTLLQPAELGHKEEMVPEDLGVLSHVIRSGQQGCKNGSSSECCREKGSN